MLDRKIRREATSPDSRRCGAALVMGTVEGDEGQVNENERVEVRGRRRTIGKGKSGVGELTETRKLVGQRWGSGGRGRRGGGSRWSQCYQPRGGGNNGSYGSNCFWGLLGSTRLFFCMCHPVFLFSFLVITHFNFQT